MRCGCKLVDELSSLSAFNCLSLFCVRIGFDLVDVGKDEVTVRTGKQSSKKLIQCAVQALVVLFNTQVSAVI